MEVRKTATCHLYQLTKKKISLLDEIYTAWSDMTRSKRSYRENRDSYPNLHSKYPWNARNARPSDPLLLDRQHQFEIIKTNNKVEYFVRISIRPRVSIYCPLKTKSSLDGLKIHDSRLVKKDGRYDLLLAISKNVTLNGNPSCILSVDLGEKVMATVVLLHPSCNSSPRPMFLGKNVRRLRRHYAHLKKNLGQKKLLRVIKRLGNTESRKVNDILHKISKQLVRIAKENNAIILIGDLAGIRKSAKGKRMNRIVANMPYYRLTQFVTYKASWEGVHVLTTREWYSSKTCSRCGSDYTSRQHQGLFMCHECNYQINSDFNGAKNLGKRLMEHVFVNGTVGFRCQNRTVFCDPVSVISEEKSTEPSYAQL